MGPTPLLSPGQVIGQHRVERLLGRGGIAEVYLVTELAFEVQQALKVMIGDDDDWGRRLIREGRAQYLVQHPNLVRVFGSLTVQGRPALVMEYVAGTDLRRWLKELRRRGCWPVASQALELFQGVLAGVGAVHARGLVHRDLKPANILVEPTEGGVVPKVTDFGLVKDVVGGHGGGEVTVAGTIMGTQGYIAPEQIWALPEIDARADVFALGCILYLLLCKKPAFGDVDTSVTFAKVLNEEYTDPRAHAPDLLDSLYLAIRHSLVSERARRIPSCEALWDVIQRGRPALEELGLLDEREDLPAVAQSSAPLAGGGLDLLGDATTTRRPLVDVETVAMPMELVEHLLVAEQPTQEEPREAAAPPEPAARAPDPVVDEVPRAVVATAPPRRPPRPPRGRRPIPWGRAAMVALVTVGLGGLAVALAGVLIVARLPEPATPGALAPVLEPQFDLAPSTPELELPSAGDRQVRSDPPPVSVPPAPSSKPAPAPAPSTSPQGVVAPAPAVSPEAVIATAPAASPEAGVASASSSSEQAPVAAPAASPAPGSAPEPSPEPPPPVEPPMGRVVIDGTAQRVCLLSHADGQTHCAARVPVGGYDVLLFVGEDPVTAGFTEVHQDAVTSLRCDAAFLTCYSR